MGRVAPSSPARPQACDTPDQIVKGDYPMLGGAILDIDWSPDNARIVVVGEGQPPAKVRYCPAACPGPCACTPRGAGLAPYWPGHVGLAAYAALHAQVIMWDSGNSVGDIGGGHIKKIVSCSYKPTRPFRIATGSEDLKVRPATPRRATSCHATPRHATPRFASLRLAPCESSDGCGAAGPR